MLPEARQTNEAVTQYQRVLRDFAGEEILARLSRQNLMALGAPASTFTGTLTDPQPGGSVQVGGAQGRSFDWMVGGGDPSAEPASAAGEAKLRALEQEIALLESQLDTVTTFPDPRVRMRTLRQFFPAPGLEMLERELLAKDAEIARLGATLADDHPELKAAQRARETYAKRAEQEVVDIIAGEEARLRTLRSVLQKLNPGALPNSVTSGTEFGKAPTLTEAEEIRRVQTMVAHSPDLLDAPGSDGTPLQRAAAKGQLAVVRFLLDQGARVDARGSGGGTALHTAAETGHKAVVELLLERGAKLNAEDSQGRTPLHLAAGKGFLAITRFLLERGADPSALGQGDVGSPLWTPVSGDRLEIVGLLLEKGANPNAFNEGHFPPLSRARSLDMVRLLLGKGADPNLDGGVRLLQAVMEGDLPVATALLAAKAKPDVEPQGSSSTPLEEAIRQGRRPMAELLLKHGADLNRVTPSHAPGSPLHEAAAAADSGWLAWALDHGGDPNLKAPKGPPLLHWADLKDRETGVGRSNLWERVPILLERGANPNVEFTTGGRLVHQAALFARAEEWRLLRESKAELDVKAPGGFTPLMVAAANTNDAGVEALLAAGVEVNETDDQRNTALHFAAVRKSVPIVRRLIAAKADPTRVNGYGRTAAHLVVSMGQAQVVAAQAGVDLQFMRQLISVAASAPSVSPGMLTPAQEEILKLLQEVKPGE
jgi:ankyrin repeat protein